MTDRESIENLINEFAWLLDHGQAEKVPHLFTESGKLKAAGQDIQGQEELQAAFKFRASQTHISRHVYTNIRLTIDNENQATGTSILTAYRHDGDGLVAPIPSIIADTQDKYERGNDGKWYFSERINTPIFINPELLAHIDEEKIK